MNINGPSLIIARPLPEDITPQAPVPGGGYLPSWASDNPVLDELADLQNGRFTVQSAITDMNAMREDLLCELDALANHQRLPPQQREAIKNRMDQQLTLVIEQTVRRLQNLPRTENVVKQDISAAIAQFVDLAANLTASLNAMRSGSGSGGGKIA